MANYPASLPTEINTAGAEFLGNAGGLGVSTIINTLSEDVVALATKMGTGADTPLINEVLVGTGTGTTGWSTTLNGLTITNATVTGSVFTPVYIDGTTGRITISATADGGDYNFAVDTTGTLAFYGSAGATLNLKLLDGTLYTDTIGETTAAAGVTVDSVLLKDGLVDYHDIESGWSTRPDSWGTVTYLGNRSFTAVATGDLTTQYSVGTRVEITPATSRGTQSLDLESGSTQSASITDAAQTGLDVTGDLTMEAWVNLESLPSTVGNDFTIMGKWVSAGNQESYLFLIDTQNDQLEVYYNSTGAAGGRCQYRSRATLTAHIGEWVHVAVTLDVSAKDAFFYINGTEVGTIDVSTAGGTSIFNSTAGFIVGQFISTNYFDGKMKEARVWSTLRTGDQIRDTANNECTGSESNLVGCWRFQGDYLDQTSNNNDLTSSGSPVFATDSPFTSTIYGVITKTAYSNPSTTINVFTGYGYHMPEDTITTLRFSKIYAPAGFPMGKENWQVVFADKGVDAVYEAVTVAGTWYDQDWSKLIVPIGAWNINYSVAMSAARNAGGTGASARATLSTTTNSESNFFTTTAASLSVTFSTGGTGTYIPRQHATNSTEQTMSSETTLYLLLLSVSTGTDLKALTNGVAPSIIKATLSYV
jgi:hypothetical protein